MTETATLQVQHTSLQFSDRETYQEHDVRALFALGQAFPIKTGTEAGKDGRPANGTNHNRELLQDLSSEFGHAIQFGRDSWVAVDKSIVAKGSLVKDQVFLASHNEIEDAQGQDRVMAVIGFDHVDTRIGRISQGAVHYATGGAFPGSPNHDLNIKCAQGINRWMVNAGKGTDLAFVNGDFNMPDPKTDFSFDGTFVSMADELHQYKNTGHGPIDGMCAYARDVRVSAKWFRVLDDKVMFMNTDHYVVRGAWESRLLN